VEDELRRFEDVLDRGVEWIREMMDRGLDREAMIEEFGKRMRSRAEETGTDAAEARFYELANPRSMSVDGISRYWRRRKES
jgi:hypothetical protein